MILSLLAALLLQTTECRADLGPKPTMSFEFKVMPGGAPELSAFPLSVNQLECQKSDCSDAAPLKVNGPQGFSCQGYPRCGSMAYGYGPFQQIEARYPDRVRKSQVFPSTGLLASVFEVKVLAEGLDVELISAKGDQSKMLMGMYDIAPAFIYRQGLLALLLTLAAELTLLFCYLRKKNTLGFLWPLSGWAMGTIFTYCALYLLGLSYSIYGASSTYWLYLLTTEAAVVLVEGTGFYVWMRKRVSFRDCLLLSFAANGLSFLGTFVY